MCEYVSVLSSVICLSEIKRISIRYNNGTSGNRWIHSLWIIYKDGEEQHIKTTDFQAAKTDYENLRTALLKRRKGNK